MAAPVQRLIANHKLDPASLKSAFDAENLLKAGANDKTKKLVENIRDCIRDGIDRNRRDYRLFKSMDWAYDQPFYQIAYTQLRGLLSGKPDDNKVKETVNSWGLTHLLPDLLNSDGTVCCNPNGTPKKSLNLPFLTNIYVPVVMAYLTIRWAKLFNDRDLVPLYKYEPVQFTKENRLRCEVITQVVQRQSAWFDYKADERQSILQALMYGICINFPREAWFTEKQEDEKGEAQIVREGLRFNMPHPSRMYYDPFQRVSSLNSNSGCTYAGYWELCRYKDIYDNPHYWNKEKIQYGAQNWFDFGGDGYSNFLDEVFPCTLKFPTRLGNSTPGGSGGSGALDRQTDAANYYTSGDYGSATLKTEHFHQIIPADYGLGSYEHPIWFRFVFAADNTVIWAEPLAYDRLPTYAYDADFNRSRFRSLPLEIMPFQDQISNLLTQWGVAVRENLRNPIFVNKEMVPEEALRALINNGNKQYSGREYIPFAGTMDYRFKEERQQAFHTPQLTHHQVGEISNLISGILDMLDRIMQLSPQEIGQAASHEQTAEETKVIAQNTSTRVTFTGSFIDDGIYAKKVMIYDATMAYADDEIVVGISSSFAATEEELNKLMKAVGLTIHDDTDYTVDDPNAMRTVKAKKSALRIEAFASTRDAANRINNPLIADAMSKIFLAIASNPVLIQSLGSMQLVELLNQIIVAAGLPKEFRLKGQKIDLQASQEEQAAQAAEQLKQFAEQVKGAIGEAQQATLQAAAEQTQQIVAQATTGLAEQLKPVVEATAQSVQVNQAQQQDIEVLKAAVGKLTEAITQVAAATIPPPAPPGGPPPGSVIPLPPAAVPAGATVPIGVPA